MSSSLQTRLHGSNSYRVPYLYSEESAAVLAKFLDAKHRLMPYLYACAIEAHEKGVPIMRQMGLEFEDDPACEGLDKQVRVSFALSLRRVGKSRSRPCSFLLSRSFSPIAPL